MPLVQNADISPPVWDFVHDEVLLEIAATHPEISELKEMMLKNRLLEIMAAADVPVCELDLKRLFREAMENVGNLRAGKLKSAPPDAS